MKRNFYDRCFFFGLCIAGLASPAVAQTVTVSSIAPGSVCPGGVVAINYTVTGVFSTTNVFSAQLSEVTGQFSASPVVIGSIKGAGTGVLNAVIPPSTVGGSSYRIRIVATAPARIGPTSLPTLTVFVPPPPGTLTPAAYCEGDVAPVLGANPSAGGSLNWYGPNATGGTASPVAPRPNTNLTGKTLYYVSQTVGGCESPRMSIPVTVKDKPQAPGTKAVGYCVGQTATALTASATAGATLNWYTTASGGAASAVAPLPLTTAIGSTTYYVSQTLNGCESPRTSLVVTIGGIPPAPTATASATYCEGASATALSANGQNLNWYGAASGGLATASPTIPSTKTPGTTQYYVSQTVGGCESARTVIAIVVKPAPGAPAVAPAPAYCLRQTAVALTATPSAGATLNWYGTAATGGSPSKTPPVPATTGVGTTAYYVSQSVGSCESPRTAIVVMVKPTPSAPTVVSPVVVCQNQTATALTATSSAGATLNWYEATVVGGSLPSAPVPLTKILGSTTYYVSQSVGGCEGPRNAIVVTVNALPAPPRTTPLIQYCEGTTAQPLAAVGQNLKWYGTNQTGGSASGAATVPSTAAAAIGTTNYYVTQTVGGCESDRAAISVRVKDTPVAPKVSAVDFCQGTPAPTLTATLVTSATPNWYGTNAGGGTAQSSAPTPQNSAVGTNTYYVSQVLDGCEGPRAGLNVRVKATPVAPGVSPVGFCNNGPAQRLTATGTNLNWYDAFDQRLNEAPTPGTGAVGNQTFKVSQTSENCEGPKARLTVVINPLPGQPGVSNLSYCQSQPDQPAQNLLPLTASGQNLRWYNPDGNAFANAPIPAIDRAGVQTYQVSQTVNNCEGGRATMQVTVNTTAAPTVATPLVTYCINDKAVPLQATAENGGSLRWVDPYGRVREDTPTPATQNTNVKPEGDAFYVYQIGANGCYSPRSAIRVVVNTTPTLALLAPTTSVNLGLTVPLQLKFTGSGPYSYTITDGYSGTSLRSDTSIAVMPRGNTIYQVASVMNACGAGLPGNPATATVTVRVPTVSTSALTSTTLCAGTLLMVPFTTTGQFNLGNLFKIELVSLADTSKKFSVQAATTDSPVTGLLSGTLAGGQYYVRVKATNPGVGVTGSNSPTLLTVRSMPTVALTGSPEIYEGTPASLTFAFGGDGPWTVTYADSIQTYSATTTESPYVTEVRPGRSTTYRVLDVTNGCGTALASGTARIVVQPLLGVDDNTLDAYVKAYPVPTGHSLTVELNLPLTHDPAQLSLTDLQGRPVLQQTTRARQTQLDLSSQPSGLYILHIRVGERQAIRKILKQ